MTNTFTQNVFMVGADSSGDVQAIAVGKNDNDTPIFYELETQDLEFGDRTHLKAISDKIVLFTHAGIDSSVEIKKNDGDYEPIDVTLEKRVNIGRAIKSEGFFFNFKWSGTSDSTSPIFEGIYLENVTDKGITYG